MNEVTTPENKPNKYGENSLVKIVLTYLVIGGVLYAGVYYFFLSKNGASYNQTKIPPVNNEQSAPATPSNQVTPATPTFETQNKVTLTSESFTPKNLSVKVGDTVTWENTSGSVATVSSDPHPTHTNYAPLNLGRFNDGESLSLKFDKPGTYGYHNHLNSGQSGKIIVE